MIETDNHILWRLDGINDKWMIHHETHPLKSFVCYEGACYLNCTGNRIASQQNMKVAVVQEVFWIPLLRYIALFIH